MDCSVSLKNESPTLQTYTKSVHKINGHVALMDRLVIIFPQIPEKFDELRLLFPFRLLFFRFHLWEEQNILNRI